jgi:hypothetical protein
MYSHTNQSEPDQKSKEEKFNVTPLTIAPYSGIEVAIQAFIKGTHSLNVGYLPVVVTIEDVFGRRYSTQVKAER